MKKKYIAPHIQSGQKGEELVMLWLKNKEYTILGKNIRTRSGEIDIVIVDASRQVYIVEVKTRATDYFGDPVHAVTRKKMQRMQRVWREWCEGEGQRAAVAAHLVIADLVWPVGAAPKLTIYWNVGFIDVSG